MGNNEEFYTMEGWATSLRDTSLSTMLSTMLNFFLLFHIFVFYTKDRQATNWVVFSFDWYIIFYLSLCCQLWWFRLQLFKGCIIWRQDSDWGLLSSYLLSGDLRHWGLTLPNNLCPLSLKLPINTLCHYRWLLSYLIIERKFLTFPIKLHICRRFTIFRSWIGSLDEDLF